MSIFNSVVKYSSAVLSHIFDIIAHQVSMSGAEPWRSSGETLLQQPQQLWPGGVPTSTCSIPPLGALQLRTCLNATKIPGQKERKRGVSALPSAEGGYTIAAEIQTLRGHGHSDEESKVDSEPHPLRPAGLPGLNLLKSSRELFDGPSLPGDVAGCSPFPSSTDGQF